MGALSGASVAAATSRMGGGMGDYYTTICANCVSLSAAVCFCVAISAHKLKVLKAKRDVWVVDVLRVQWDLVVNDFPRLHQAPFAHPSGLLSVCVSCFFPCAGSIKA